MKIGAFGITTAVVCMALYNACTAFGGKAEQNSPEIVLWAWERCENLLFLKEETRVKVAFYAGIIVFREGETVFTPRRQLLIVPPEIPLTAVVRIENRQGFIPDKQQISEAVRIIAITCIKKGISGCQIDFDCRSSEFGFFKSMIEELKDKLPSSMPLSITVIASLSHSGSMVDSLPVDEAVPMLFRTGPDEDLIRKGLAGQSFMKASACQKAAGISLDEPLPHAKYLQDRKLYIFNTRPWTQKDFVEALLKIKLHIKKKVLP